MRINPQASGPSITRKTLIIDPSAQVSLLIPVKVFISDRPLFPVLDFQLT
jgi:hypothetical protein